MVYNNKLKNNMVKTDDKFWRKNIFYESNFHIAVMAINGNRINVLLEEVVGDEAADHQVSAMQVNNMLKIIC